MATTKITKQITIKLLRETDFAALHTAFAEAFSDYLVPINSTEQQLSNTFAQNAVDLSQSVGAFSGRRIVGFSINGFGMWDGKRTVYDSGTGVIPDFRKSGVAESLFEYMLPYFAEIGFDQVLLEVIEENHPARRLYEKLGFEYSRKLSVFQRQMQFEAAAADGLEIRLVDECVEAETAEFADGSSSWQNSIAAFKRSPARKGIFAAFSGEECVGYTTAFLKSGTIQQVAVRKDHRRKGIATAMLSHLQKTVGDDKCLRIQNLDENIESAREFFLRSGFVRALSQFEMKRKL